MRRFAEVMIILYSYSILLCVYIYIYYICYLQKNIHTISGFIMLISLHSFWMFMVMYNRDLMALNGGYNGMYN